MDEARPLEPGNVVLDLGSVSHSGAERADHGIYYRRLLPSDREQCTVSDLAVHRGARRHPQKKKNPQRVCTFVSPRAVQDILVLVPALMTSHHNQLVRVPRPLR